MAVRMEKPLLEAGSARWSARFSRGDLPVTSACSIVTRKVTYLFTAVTKELPLHGLYVDCRLKGRPMQMEA